MKDEEIKRFLKENMEVQAPDNFTLNVMDAINADAKTQTSNTSYSIPAKGMLFTLSIFFLFSVIWSIFNGAESQIDMSPITKYLQFDLPRVELTSILFSNIVMYVSLAFLGFIVLDYFIHRDKKVEFAA